MATVKPPARGRAGRAGGGSLPRGGQQPASPEPPKIAWTPGPAKVDVGKAIAEVQLPDTLAFAHVTAEAAGRAILPHFRVAIDVENKDRAGGYDPVTVADRAAESVIREAIRARFPAHGVFGEEHGREAGSEPWTWVIDPMDGTKSFVLGQLHWGVLIALNDGARPVLGVAY